MMTGKILNRNYFLRILAFIASCAVLFSCILTDEETGPDKHMIAGRLFYENKIPAAGAEVTIRPQAFIPDTSGVLGKRSADTLTVQTDNNGEFFIESIDKGTYLIEGHDDAGYVFMIDSVIVVYPDYTITLSDTLKPSGTLRGTVTLSEGEDPRKVFVLPFGLNRFALPDSTGEFVFAGMAEGAYDLRIMTPLDYEVLDISRVRVVSGDTTDLGALDLIYTGIPSVRNIAAVCDSMNIAVTVSWQKALSGIVKGYNVYRKRGDSAFIRVNTAPVPDTFFIDTRLNGLVPGESYVYAVTALDSAGNEGQRKQLAAVEVASLFQSLETGIPPIPCAQGGCNFDIAPDHSIWMINNAGTVLHYDSSGALLHSWAVPAEQGMFGKDIAADGDSGVYVVHRLNRSLEKLNAEGASLWQVPLSYNRYTLDLHVVDDTVIIWGKEERIMTRVSPAGEILTTEEITMSLNIANPLEYSPDIGFHIFFGEEIWLVDYNGDIGTQWAPESQGSIHDLILTAAGNWILCWSSGVVEFYNSEKESVAHLLVDGQNSWDLSLKHGKLYMLGIPFGEFRIFESGFLSGF
jgi:hypothetical protein